MLGTAKQRRTRVGSDSNRNGGVFPAACRHGAERSSLGVSISGTIAAVGKEAQEPDPLKQTCIIAIRMAIVLAFLLGMPLVAVPQIAEHLQGLLRATSREPAANHQPSVVETERAAYESESAELVTTVTMLASDRPQLPPIRPNPEALTAVIEALKAQFVEAGVSYMLLEQIGADSVTYRFQFDLPVAAGSAYRKRFQVVDDAPDEAMRRALAELRQWRVASREPAHLERPTVILR